jgi:glyoxylase-like metal-dependent hydrolase (beta-lactamase superfamily II)
MKNDTFQGIGDRAMETAARWYETQELDDAICLLREPYVHPFARCNIWLVRGSERNLLIDSGTGLLPLKPVLPGIDDRPLIALATHVHFDHIGALHEFPDRRAHPSEAAAFTSMPDSVTLAHLFRELEQPVTRLPTAGWTAAEYGVRPAPIVMTLSDGDCLDLGNRRLIALHVPGHSKDSIALFEERTGVLFSGDALYDGELIDSFPSSNVDDYRDTMQRLKELDISVGHGGHGPSFDNARKNVLVEEYLAGRREQGCPRGG